VYAFYATSSDKDVLGNKAKLSKAQAEDSLLHTRYAAVELKIHKKIKT
jgi:hypothetical protein